MIKVRVRVRFDEIEKFEVRSFTRHNMQLMTRMTIDDAMQSKTFEIHSLSGIGQVSLTFRTLNSPTLISFHFKKL